MASALPENFLPDLGQGSPETSHYALDDLVPGDSGSGIYGDHPCAPHETEYIVQRALLSMPHVQFSSLQVHRLADGVCLTGVVKVKENLSRSHFDRVAGTAAGVSKVLNRLMFQRSEQENHSPG